MRDDQVRRYARHVLVPDIGGLGQTALLVATARMEIHDSDADAAMFAAMFLVAGGVGKLVIRGATDAQIEQLAARGADTAINASTPTAPLALETQAPPPRVGSELVLPPKPAWWPSADGDDLALAYWRGSIAATRWMSSIANG
ncbi:MAG: hypothetical protein M4D80_04520 [Myxococcota bacterium]|nr:hypothetical protein [Myxococcota bacterium]